MPAKKKPAAKRAPKKAPAAKPAAGDEALFDRVAAILEQSRANVVRAVNSNMVLAYWLIGREILQEIQGGGERAAYGKQVLANLAQQLTRKYGPGFSVTNLQNFRKFHQTYSQRLSQIQHPLGIKSGLMDEPPSIQHPVGVELAGEAVRSRKSRPPGAELVHSSGKSYPQGSELVTGFSPQLSWSHYRALMRVENTGARDFYEREAIAGGWDKRTLERQIHSYYYARLLKSQNPKKMLASGQKLQIQPEPAVETLRNPYVPEFLGLPEVAKRVEQLADNFAGALLMPCELLNKRWEARPQSMSEGAWLQATARHFKVSTQALFWRMVALGLWQKNQQALLGKQGPKEKNPAPAWYSRRFLERALWGIDKGEISVRRTLGILNLDIGEFRSQCEAHGLEVAIGI